MVIRLRKSISFITIAIILILSGLLFLGYRHHVLQKNYETLLVQSKKMVTDYTAIREQTTKALLNGTRDQFARNENELNAFQSRFAQLIESARIPEEFRMTFLNQLELPATIMLLQQMSREGGNIEAANELNDRMRATLGRLILFDRLVVNHSKRTLTGFHLVVTGALALVLFFIVSLLAIGHRTVIIPLVDLSRQVREVSAGLRNGLFLSGKWAANEVTDLGRSFHNLFQQQTQEAGNLTRRNEILYSVHQAGLACTNAATPEELFEKVSQALLFGKNYCMVAINVPDHERNSLIPALTDGLPAIMERIPGKLCLAFLLSEAKSRGEKFESSARAFRQGKPVVDTDILAEIPEGNLTGTILEEKYANCISVPLIWKQTILGVITLYSTKRDSFAAEEVSLLDKMANDMAFALHFLHTKHEEDRQKKINSLLLQEAGAGIIALATDGTVLAMHPESQRVLGKDPEALAGEVWFDLAVPEERGELRRNFAQFLEPGKETPDPGGAMTIVIGRNGKRRTFRYAYHFQENFLKEKESVLCVIIDITEQQALVSALAAGQARHDSMFDALPEIVAVISPEGAILEMNAPGRTALEMGQDGNKENNILSLFFQSKSKSELHLLEYALQRQDSTTLEMVLENPAGAHRVTVAPLSTTPAEGRQLLLIAGPVSGDCEKSAADVSPMQVAALSETASNVANEINNLSNGIINYAQLLLDGTRDGKRREDQVALLQRIISEGERSAAVVKKLLGPSVAERKETGQATCSTSATKTVPIEGFPRNNSKDYFHEQHSKFSTLQDFRSSAISAAPSPDSAQL